MNAMVPQHAVTDLERMARAIAASKLFGIQTPEQALALCLVAQAEGRHPATAAQDYHILQGRPAKKADAMLRDFLAGGGKVEWHTLTDAMADATFSHPAGGSARIDWTLARAKQAGLTTPMWSKYPRQMLRSRTVSEGVRTVYPMATSGMYVPEEVADFAPEKGEVIDHAPVPDHVPAPAQPRISAYQAKKDGKGERARVLNHEMLETQTVTEALAWRIQHSSEIKEWPKSWIDALDERHQIHVDELRALSAKLVGADEETGEIEGEANEDFPGDRRTARAQTNQNYRKEHNDHL